MKVSWTEQYTNLSLLDWFPEANLSDFDQKHKGNVIGITNSFWYGTMLIVACEDGKIREVSIEKAIVE